MIYRYVAPEYAMTGHLLVKSDVYSYGVVLLELLTGRKPVDMSQPAGQENLVSWVSVVHKSLPLSFVILQILSLSSMFSKKVTSLLTPFRPGLFLEIRIGWKSLPIRSLEATTQRKTLSGFAQLLQLALLRRQVNAPLWEKLYNHLKWCNG